MKNTLMKNNVSKVKRIQSFKPRLKKLAKLMLVGITVATALAVTNPVMAQSIASSNVTENVRLPNAEYTQSVVDMRVKVLGGEVKLERTWVNGRWYLNSSWANLRFISDALDESIKTVDRAGTRFERSGSANLYAAGKSYIQKTENGWRWYNQNGDWITYDEAGRMIAYGDHNDIRVGFVLDAEGRRIGVKDHHGQTIYTFEYDANELLTKVTDNTGCVVQYHWRGNLLEKVTDVRGNAWQYKYDGNGQLIQRIEPDNGVIQIDYTYSTPAPKPAMTSGKNAGEVVSGSVSSSSALEADAKVARVGSMTEKTGATTLWQVDYNKQSRRYTAMVEDALGKKDAYVYDAQGRLISQSVNDEVQTTIERDGEFKTKNTNARGFSQITQYDHAKNPVIIISPDGSTQTYTYDNTFNKPLSYVNQLGIKTEWTYDDKGNTLTRIDAVGKDEQRFNSWTYDQYGQLATYTINSQEQGSAGYEGSAITTRYTYDANGNIKSVTDPMNNTTQYTYNSQGQVTSVTNALGHTWVYEYNIAGDLKQVTNPLGNSISFETDTQGRIIRVTDAEGRSSTVDYAYHNKGLTVTKTDALNNSTIYQFDPQDRLIRLTLSSGDEIKQTYDARGRVEYRVDVAGNITKTQYGVTGTLQSDLPINIFYPTYQESSQYNTLDLQTEVRRDFGGDEILTTRMSYNALGMRLSVTLPNGATTQLQYDAFGNQTKHIDALGGTTQQTYDAQGNVTSVVDAKGNTHRFEYDKNGNMVKEVTPLGQVTSYGYNVVGQLIQKHDAAGNTTQYEYNEVGFMIKETLTAAGGNMPEQTVQYVYDKNGALLEAKKESVRAGGIDTTHLFRRDELGRIISEKITYDNGTSAITKTLLYSYDADGRRVSLTYPDGSVQTASYERGQLKTMTRPDGKELSWSAYEWMRAKQFEAPSVKQTLSYDALQRTAGIEAKNQGNNVLLQRSHTYDKAGNITARNTEEGDYSYGYDQLSRLTQATPPQNLQQKDLPVEGYTYDAVHNRVGSAHQVGEWLYNEDNQLLKFGAGVDEISYTYTANGHVQTETRNSITRTYEYDAADRLVRVTSKSGISEVEIARYAYDPFGRRISKTANGETIYFIYTNEGLLVELNEGGDITRAYGWELNSMYGTAPLWQAEVSNNQISTAQFHTLITDHLGTPQIAVNDQGVVTWKAVSESFGKTIINPENQISMNLRFPGQYYDDEANSHYNYFRDYNPNTGRYIQRDPIGLEAGINWYGYVKANALVAFDPLGLKVYICSRPVDIDYIPSIASENFAPWHEWIRTSTKEVGLGGDCPVPGQQCSDVPYVTETKTTDHTGQSNAPNAICVEAIEVDEDCVNRLLIIGERRGAWTPANQCQSYVSEILTRCRKKSHPVECIGSCHGINYQ